MSLGFLSILAVLTFLEISVRLYSRNSIPSLQVMGSHWSKAIKDSVISSEDLAKILFLCSLLSRVSWAFSTFLLMKGSLIICGILQNRVPPYSLNSQKNHCSILQFSEVHKDLDMLNYLLVLMLGVIPLSWNKKTSSNILNTCLPFQNWKANFRVLCILLNLLFTDSSSHLFFLGVIIETGILYKLKF